MFPGSNQWMDGATWGSLILLWAYLHIYGKSIINIKDGAPLWWGSPGSVVSGESIVASQQITLIWKWKDWGESPGSLSNWGHKKEAQFVCMHHREAGPQLCESLLCYAVGLRSPPVESSRALQLLWKVCFQHPESSCVIPEVRMQFILFDVSYLSVLWYIMTSQIDWADLEVVSIDHAMRHSCYTPALNNSHQWKI